MQSSPSVFLPYAFEDINNGTNKIYIYKCLQADSKATDFLYFLCTLHNLLKLVATYLLTWFLLNLQGQCGVGYPGVSKHLQDFN